MAEPTVLSQIIQLVREQVAVGVLPTGNESLSLWIRQATAEINRQRGLTTRKETTITLTQGTYTYALPDDCVNVKGTVLEGDDIPTGEVFSTLDFPELAHPYGGYLPSGQMVNQSVDLIRRQNASMVRREGRWRLLEDELVIDFEPETGQKLKVIYDAEDRNIETMPERHWMLVIVFARKEALKIFLTSVGTSGQAVGDRVLSHNYGEMNSAQSMLEREWEAGLAKIRKEVG